jgi:hypothetical protein
MSPLSATYGDRHLLAVFGMLLKVLVVAAVKVALTAFFAALFLRGF